MTDDDSVYHALSVHLRRAKLTITHFDARPIVAKYLVHSLGAKFHREIPLFFKIPKLPYNIL